MVSKIQDRGRYGGTLKAKRKVRVVVVVVAVVANFDVNESLWYSHPPTPLPPPPPLPIQVERIKSRLGHTSPVNALYYHKSMGMIRGGKKGYLFSGASDRLIKVSYSSSRQEALAIPSPSLPSLHPSPIPPK